MLLVFERFRKILKNLCRTFPMSWIDCHKNLLTSPLPHFNLLIVSLILTAPKINFSNVSKMFIQEIRKSGNQIEKILLFIRNYFVQIWVVSTNTQQQTMVHINSTGVWKIKTISQAILVVKTKIWTERSGMYKTKIHKVQLVE